MLALLSFAVMTLLLFSFAVGPNTEVLRRHAAGYLWLGALFSSSSLFASSFRIETESSAMEQLILTPVSTVAIFYGKALANALQLLLILHFQLATLAEKQSWRESAQKTILGLKIKFRRLFIALFKK